MKFIISGPWLPKVHQHGRIIEHGLPPGLLLELVVVGQFKGQVVSLPSTWINHVLIWFFNIRFDTEPGVYRFAPVIK